MLLVTSYNVLALMYYQMEVRSDIQIVAMFAATVKQRNVKLLQNLMKPHKFCNQTFRQNVCLTTCVLALIAVTVYVCTLYTCAYTAIYRTHSKLRSPFLLVRFSYKYWGGGGGGVIIE